MFNKFNKKIKMSLKFLFKSAILKSFFRNNYWQTYIPIYFVSFYFRIISPDIPVPELLHKKLNFIFYNIICKHFLLSPHNVLCRNLLFFKFPTKTENKNGENNLITSS